MPADCNPAAAAYDRKNRRRHAQKVVRYEHEKKRISGPKALRQLEEQRDLAKQHGKPFGMAVMFLQVAILLNSIAGLMKAQKIW